MRMIEQIVRTPSTASVPFLFNIAVSQWEMHCTEANIQLWRRFIVYLDFLLLQAPLHSITQKNPLKFLFVFFPRYEAWPLKSADNF